MAVPASAAQSVIRMIMSMTMAFMAAMIMLAFMLRMPMARMLIMMMPWVVMIARFTRLMMESVCMIILPMFRSMGFSNRFCFAAPRIHSLQLFLLHMVSLSALSHFCLRNRKVLL
jgi:hypothetical protein